MLLLSSTSGACSLQKQFSSSLNKTKFVIAVRLQIQQTQKIDGCLLPGTHLVKYYVRQITQHVPVMVARQRPAHS